MTDDLHTLIQQWLTMQQQGTVSSDDPLLDWSRLMTRLQQSSWEYLPEQHAELISLMTQESIEFTRFASQLILQNHTLQDIQGFVKGFKEHISQLSRDWILKRWQIPEQLHALIHTSQLTFQGLGEQPMLQGLNTLLESNAEHLTLKQQRLIREGTQLLYDYQIAFGQYAELFDQINQSAIKGLTDKIDSAPEPINSLKALHEAWTHAYEKEYASVVATEHYQTTYGQISNASFALREFYQTFRNEQLAQIGIASETSLSLAFEHIHRLRKHVRQLEKELSVIPELQRSLSELRLEIDQLRNNSND
ncbi:poly(R)-hydroxyalkanoic acid synthase subunit PhaE [Nitrincola nitratireducens]|uniref:Poly(3-hydroxyalkanoate) polymerase subunit PhaE n=1 Tax=Nitrincola nitratireducens TaxID=1229521 RepID=W9V1E6_9GAMM|nr:poly(R)-hydroxyalkanoic acid synthase subunit PhaE [Nitrincola nitratireducens]EXJ09952.1 poly(R)-hydroxyalkanoic acid synthase, class III, PhaE subunit [Nitrincola nitratireducens]